MLTVKRRPWFLPGPFPFDRARCADQTVHRSAVDNQTAGKLFRTACGPSNFFKNFLERSLRQPFADIVNRQIINAITA
jgi:hypothetical protein